MAKSRGGGGGGGSRSSGSSSGSRKAGGSPSSADNKRVVQQRKDGDWEVVAPHASRASAVEPTQREAQDRARTIVRNAGGGEVVTKGKDGKIRDSDTVAPGHDPNPPKDKK